MKKQLFVIASLLLAVTAVRAQKPERAQVLVHYKFSHLRDTNNRANPYKENMVLFLGANSSGYKSYDRQLEDALFRKQMQEQAANSADGNINVRRRVSGSGTEYYQFPALRKMVRKERLINNYLIEDALPAINWKISSDTATFGGLLCQKAITRFRGRDYTAWFSPDLPFHSGPWKLNGLPGAILEAYDTKKEVEFKFDGIEKVAAANKNLAANEQQPHDSPGGVTRVIIGMDDVNADPNTIEVPSGGIKTTEKEFAALKEAMRKDPNAFVQSMMGGSGAMQGNGPKPNIKIQVAPAPVINNPIELSAK
jgi:GLPGLI family protein